MVNIYEIEQPFDCDSKRHQSKTKRLPIIDVKEIHAIGGYRDVRHNFKNQKKWDNL